MGDKSWKQAERDIGRYFGTMRQVGSGSLGRPDRSKSDVRHPDLFIEAKHRKSDTALKVALKKERDAVRKYNRRAVLLFPQTKVDDVIIAVHSDDLVSVTQDWIKDPSFFGLSQSCNAIVVPRLRSTFKVLEDAEEFAEEESLSAALLGIRVPAMQGFILVFRAANLLRITTWHAIGVRLIQSRGAKLTTEEKLAADAVSRFTRIDEHDDPILESFTDILEKFEHAWHPPKPKKKRTRKTSVAETIPSIPAAGSDESEADGGTPEGCSIPGDACGRDVDSGAGGELLPPAAGADGVQRDVRGFSADERGDNVPDAAGPESGERVHIV